MCIKITRLYWHVSTNTHRPFEIQSSRKWDFSELISFFIKKIEMFHCYRHKFNTKGLTSTLYIHMWTISDSFVLLVEYIYAVYFWFYIICECLFVAAGLIIWIFQMQIYRELCVAICKYCGIWLSASQQIWSAHNVCSELVVNNRLGSGACVWIPGEMIRSSDLMMRFSLLPLSHYYFHRIAQQCSECETNNTPGVPNVGGCV
jgi:hypothetical protein